MITQHFKMMCDYNYWAHHQIWDCVLKLTDEQLSAVNDCFGLSVHEQVALTLGAEWLWSARLRGISPSTQMSVAMVPTLEAIRQKWIEVESDLRSYVEHVRDPQLKEVITYTTTYGQAQRSSRAEILSHAFNHSTDHRARILVMLNHFGIVTDEHSLLAYFRDDPDHRQQISMTRFRKSSAD